MNCITVNELISRPVDLHPLDQHARTNCNFRCAHHDVCDTARHHSRSLSACQCKGILFRANFLRESPLSTALINERKGEHAICALNSTRCASSAIEPNVDKSAVSSFVITPILWTVLSFFTVTNRNFVESCAKKHFCLKKKVSIFDEWKAAHMVLQLCVCVLCIHRSWTDKNKRFKIFERTNKQSK